MGCENAAEDMIAITVKRHNELLEAEKMLLALEGAGVDNWDGYGEAMETLEQMDNE